MCEGRRKRNKQTDNKVASWIDRDVRFFMYSTSVRKLDFFLEQKRVDEGHLIIHCLRGFLVVFWAFGSERGKEKVICDRLFFAVIYACEKDR